MSSRLASYFEHLRQALDGTLATDRQGDGLSVEAAIDWSIATARKTHAAGNKLLFIGNGGSAGIASHMANDFSKNGGLRATALNDGAVLTCLSNDFGYEYVFSKQIEWHARPGDFLVAISSSGQSQNILNAVAAARETDCSVLTLSGFAPDNPLRNSGDVNLYVPSGEYGLVEMSHMAFCSSILDLANGWNADQTSTAVNH